MTEPHSSSQQFAICVKTDETRFEDSKQLLGMGAYEVRSWTGWSHPMTLVILAHFFVVRMNLRLKKSPSGDLASGRHGVGGGLAQARVR